MKKNLNTLAVFLRPVFRFFFFHNLIIENENNNFTQHKRHHCKWVFETRNFPLPSFPSYVTYRTDRSGSEEEYSELEQL